METHLYRAVLLAGAIVLGGAAPGRAQTFQANVPFAFQTTNAEMPPGEYSVRRLETGSPAVLLNNRDTRKSDIVMTHPTGGGAPYDAPPRMIFRCAENHCALAEIWGVTSSGGVRLLESKGKGKDHQRIAVVYLKGENVRR